MSLEAYHTAVRAQFADTIPPNLLTEVTWVREYLAAGSPAGPPILLSLAENWEGPPSDLLALQGEAPPWLDGYQFSMWGEPSFRQNVGAWLRKDEGLAAHWHGGEPLDHAAAWSGTRNIMFDIARFLRRDRVGQVVYAAPGYDYGHVFAAAGFHDGAVPSGHDRSFRPDLDGLVAAIARPEAAIVVLNVQQNPLAHQWSRDDVEQLLRAARARNLAVVFDNAHFGLVAPGVTATPAVAIWLEILAEEDRPSDWFAVRSLGKQLNCNGWGLGLVTAPERLLSPLVLQVRPEREYNINARAQYALGRFAASGGIDAATAVMNHRIHRNRTAAFHMLRQRGMEPPTAAMQVCTPFCWFSLPRGQADGSATDGMRRRILDGAGVLLGDLNPSPLAGDARRGGFAKVYLGVHPSVLDAALGRLSAIFV